MFGRKTKPKKQYTIKQGWMPHSFYDTKVEADRAVKRLMKRGYKVKFAKRTTGRNKGQWEVRTKLDE